MKRFKKASAVATELIRNIPGSNRKILKTDVILKSFLKLKINLEKTKPQIKVATIEGSLNENSDIPNTKIEMH